MLTSVLLLASMVGCSDATKTPNNCGSDMVRAVQGDQHTALLSCAGVAYGGATVRLRRGQVLTIDGLDSLAVPVVLSSDNSVVTISRHQLAAKRAGTARITETGWPCADTQPDCTLLKVIVE